MSHADCQILFGAGKALVEKNGLANYCGQEFVAGDDEAAFETYWEGNFHQEFGRYMACVLFLVGAENLAKAACVCKGMVKAAHDTTLESYVHPKSKVYLKKLNVCDYDKDISIKGYEVLRRVRNRDAHSYRKGVRSAGFPRVKHTFVPALNVLVTAMRDHGHPLP